MREAVLRGAGFLVVTAYSAEQALDILKDRAISRGLRAILTDHVLPGASGDVFVRELRNLSPSVPVLVITGMDEAEPEYAGLGVRFLHKPCAPEDLISEIRRAIGSQGGSRFRTVGRRDAGWRAFECAFGDGREQARGAGEHHSCPLSLWERAGVRG